MTEPEPLFTENEISAARQHLERISFPLSSEGAELQLLGSPEPFIAYTVAAHRVLAAAEENSLISATVEMATIIDKIEAWVDKSLAAEDETPIKPACVQGCFFCCSIRTSVFGPEALRIEEYVRERFTTAEKDELREQLNQYLEIAQTFPPRERFFRPLLCPLNKDGACTVYTARPSACRIHHSYSVDQCEAAFNDWKGEHPIPRSAMRKYCGESVTLAFADVLDFLDLDDRTFELAEAVTITLDSARVAEQFGSGENVFESAFLPEVHLIADSAR